MQLPVPALATTNSFEQSAKSLAEAAALEMRKKFPNADEVHLRFELIRALIWDKAPEETVDRPQ